MPASSSRILAAQRPAGLAFRAVPKVSRAASRLAREPLGDRAEIGIIADFVAVFGFDRRAR